MKMLDWNALAICSLKLLLLLLMVVMAEHLNVCRGADVWVTYADQTRLLSYDGSYDFAPDSDVTSSSIVVNESNTYQSMAGFGAAITDSAAWLISILPGVDRGEVMQRLFGYGEGAAGLSFLRMPIGASDISRFQYTYDDGDADPDLSRFSVDHDRSYILPVARDALSINSNLRFLGSIWSPPVWMKDSGVINNGSLLPQYAPALARYFRRFVQAYEFSGVPISLVTVQNEPLYAPTDYPGMLYTPEQEVDFAGNHLSRSLDGMGVGILSFDHNWSNLNDFALPAMAAGEDFFVGSAFHCYAGDASAMGTMHDAFPNKDIYVTECSGFVDQNADFETYFKDRIPNLFMKSVSNWAKSVVLWSLALDPTGQPHSGGCADCRGVVSIDSGSGAITYNPEFYALAHFARFVFPDALRIDSINSLDGNFISSGFINRDGRKAVVVFNNGNSDGTFKLVWRDQAIYCDLPASGLATVSWLDS